MKKLFLLLLVFALLFSLTAMTGCDDKNAGESPADTEVDWSDYYVGISCGDLSDIMISAICNGCKTRFEALGATASISEYKNDPARDISNIENFITMDADLVLDFCLDPAPLGDVTKKALDAGVKMVFAGAVPSYGFTAAVNTDHEVIGREISRMAVKWLDKSYPDAGEGAVHAAALTCSFIEALLNRSNQMIDTLEADSRAQVVYTKDGQLIDEGYSAAEEAITMDADIRLFVCANDNLALGASNYIMTLKDVDLGKFAVFAAGCTETTTKVAGDSATNASVLRGLIGYGTMDPSEGIFNCMYNVAVGDPVYDNSYVQWDELYYVGPGDYQITEQHQD